MKIGVVGHSGLVGGYISSSFPEALRFNSKNIDAIRGQSFDLLFLTTLPAEKWRANKYPQADLDAVRSVANHLGSVSSTKTLLISTVDVFDVPVGVDESDVPNKWTTSGYGANRLEFERFVNGHFGNSWSVRLPGLVGKNLKKNILYDWRHGKPLLDFPMNSQLQFYPLSRLKDDLTKILTGDPGLFHLVSEPLKLETVAEALRVSRHLFGAHSADAQKYDVQSLRTKLWGVVGKYQVSSEESLQAIRRYLSD